MARLTFLQSVEQDDRDPNSTRRKTKRCPQLGKGTSSWLHEDRDESNSRITTIDECKSLYKKSSSSLRQGRSGDDRGDEGWSERNDRRTHGHIRESRTLKSAATKEMTRTQRAIEPERPSERGHRRGEAWRGAVVRRTRHGHSPRPRLGAEKRMSNDESGRWA